VELTDVGMIQRGKNPGFAKEPSLSDWVEALVRPDDLERHPTAEILIEADVDGTHPTLPELSHNPKVAHTRLMVTGGLSV